MNHIIEQPGVVDTDDMVLIHTFVRREFRLASGVLRQVADGDVRRAAEEVVAWRARGDGPRGRPAWGSRSGVEGLEDMAVGWRARFARRKWKKAGICWLDELS